MGVGSPPFSELIINYMNIAWLEEGGWGWGTGEIHMTEPISDYIDFMTPPEEYEYFLNQFPELVFTDKNLVCEI
jgi:hypothetical protein